MTAESRSIPQLVKDMSEQTRRLVRDEMRIAEAELKEGGKRAGIGAGLGGFAAVIAFLGGGALVAAAVLALALVLPGWAAAVIVGAVLFAAAGLFALAGKKQVQSAAPTETADEMRKDVDLMRGHSHA
ncbi:phage holin family protein [Amycolatopsis pithecellobii]|uniref:Phage holin family protein n=1 Tax=Amycolatopsis pithecellobii TaxID=664692 RepID=A0A6N7YWA3_9PSEU|nr:phage holin family protein [Amycolatopsis pithecellobii]MTD57345.1 phage holin family protein [Amycolatopsis pithecellobii]